jgi:hypothetical protein
MSFILEALKKSESNQQKKSGQTVRTVHEPAPSRKRRVRLWGIGFFILLLFNGVLLLWFFGPWQHSSQPALSSTVVPTKHDAAKISSSHPTVAPVKKEVATILPTDRQPPVKAVQRSEVASLPVPRSEKKIYSLSQLPTAIHRRIPPLKMSLHAYNRDNPAGSMVQINDHILHEGDSVTDKIRLEKITAEGVVLHYDGYRFLFPRRGS